MASAEVNITTFVWTVVVNLSKKSKIHRGYTDDVRRVCLRRVVNGMDYRDVEKGTGVHHTTVLRWHRQMSEVLPNAYEGEQIQKVSELHESETFVGKKAARTSIAEKSKGMLAKTK
ncbi:MAG: hypothetical protein AAGG02_12360 [Cyanobacteria bacterium P01_H01_bin.15]